MAGGIGSKFIGLFVERPGEAGRPPDAEPEKSAAELVAEIARGSAVEPASPPPSVVNVMPSVGPQAAPVAGAALAPAVVAAAVDFESIFRAAGMDATDLDRVKKAGELLKSLPAETPLALQRQIVEASLKAFGFEIAKIVAASQNQRRALDAYVKVNDGANTKANQDAEAQIQSLRDKIASLRGEIDKRTTGQLGLAAAAQDHKAQIQKVLDFFEPGPLAK